MKFFTRLPQQFRSALHQFLVSYQQHWKNLPAIKQQQADTVCLQLQQEINAKNWTQAEILRHNLEEFSKSHFKKKIFSYLFEPAIALIIALVLTVAIRSMWFELYFIPTGSMRPTFREEDRPIVSKTAFGLNIPFQTGHFYFDPSLIQRTHCVVFTVENLPVAEPDMTYFGLFKGKKRFIKRCMGKPGDTLYFYGGKIYGIDRNGHDLIELRNSPWLDKIEHVPLWNFEFDWHALSTVQGNIEYLHQPIVAGTLDQNHNMVGLHDINKVEGSDANTFHLAGLENYALARLLTKEQLSAAMLQELVEEGLLYLELRFMTPLVSQKALLLTKQKESKQKVLLQTSTALIPLQEKHLQKICQQMYTMRFFVKEGLACPYDYEKRFLNTMPKNLRPAFPNVEDGCYEFYYGKAYKVGLAGILDELPLNHPLYSTDIEHIQKLFNLGVNMSIAYQPQSIQTHQVNKQHYPMRFAYFSQGDLCLLGAPIIKSDDVVLQKFLSSHKQTKIGKAYTVFKDRGAPLLADGRIDVEWIRKYGLRIPDHMYLMLGDNHALSADSRSFGLVPERNIQGSPNFLLWPVGERFGSPPQPALPWFTFANVFIWGITFLSIMFFYLYRRRMQRKALAWFQQRIDA